MHIFTYRWPDSDLTAEEITDLKANISNRALVLFQNFPLDHADQFAGGTFNPSSADATRGCYAYSAEDSVMDRTDWSIININDDPCSQLVTIFSDLIVNTDVQTTTHDDDIATLQALIEADIAGEGKIIAVVGNFEKDLTITDFTDVKESSDDITFIKTKAGQTATVNAYSYTYSGGKNNPVDIELTA